MDDLQTEPTYTTYYWKNPDDTLVKKTVAQLLDENGKEISVFSKTEGVLREGAFPITQHTYEEYVQARELEGQRVMDELQKEEEAKQAKVSESLQKLGLTLEDVNILLRR